MEMKAIADAMRAAGVRRIELFDAPRSPLTGEFPGIEQWHPETKTEPAPVDLTEALGIESMLEVKEPGVCCVRGCSEPSGGAMAGRLSPEMCRDHALQMGGVRNA